MPWSWVNTEYSIHQVHHHPKIDSFPLPASFSSLGGCCTRLSTLPQLQINQWIESQLPLRLPPNPLPPSTPPILVNHSLQVHLQTRSVTVSECISKFTPSRSRSASPKSLDHGLPVDLQTLLITASKCISELTKYRSPIASPNLLDHGLKVYLWVHSTSAAKCISKFAPSRPPSASPNSIDPALQVPLSVHPISASKCISELAQLCPLSISLRRDGGCTEIQG